MGSTGVGDELAAVDAGRHPRPDSSAFQSVRHRLLNRHPITGIPTREPFFQAIGDDLKGGVKSATLGVIRFAQFHRLAAVDRPSADQTLRIFANRLTQTLGPGRPVAQIGQDTFAVWYCDLAGPKAAGDALKGLAEILGAPIGGGDDRVIPDVRVGAALAPNDGTDARSLLDRAIAAASKAGRAGSGRLAFFSDESAAAAHRRFSIEPATARRRSGKGELALHYQPVIDLNTARVVGAEALLRYEASSRTGLGVRAGPVHPGAGTVRPDGRGRPVDPGDRLQQERAVSKTRGLVRSRSGSALSERQFRDPDLTAIVARALEHSGLKPQRLELELTEAALMEDIAHTRRVFGELNALGVSLAIDDFGAGASSLGDLAILEVQQAEDRPGVRRRRGRSAEDSQGGPARRPSSWAGGSISTCWRRAWRPARRPRPCVCWAARSFKGFFFARSTWQPTNSPARLSTPNGWR